jgi:hypothetical protein
VEGQSNRRSVICDEDDPGRRKASSDSSNSSSSSSSKASPMTPMPLPKTKKAGRKGSRATANPVVVPLAAPINRLAAAVDKS